MNVFDIVFWAALALSVISLIVAVILFFKDKIWLVVGYFTGVKSGKRMAGRVHMHSTSSKPDVPAKPKREWKRGEQKTVQLEDQPTMPLGAERATVKLDDGPATEVLKDAQPAWQSQSAPAQQPFTAPLTTGGTAVMNDATAPAGGTAVLHPAASADGPATMFIPNPAAAPAPAAAGSIAVDAAPEQGTVILQEAPPLPVQESGTVILTGGDTPQFRITERIMLVFSDEVIL